ncbi:PTS sugar transporter subunit IIA [Propionispora vibrioides]|uniref:PTS system IIA component, Gat family n=1 Tax=Propionispora vibrioides TaxID=112903 RepID=A0A1H8UKP0_9FIRM|nr:PTS sugar transporter subunit IIA [Propionispora vibrioides]SEP03782.1 PTS system IIA component, Gat family [Propionispora vibrioides]
MSLTELFDESLIELNGNFSSQAAFFKAVSLKLQNLQYVKNGFFEKIQEREKKFPTGLKTKSFNVAIPHTDPEYVNRSFIYVIRMRNSLPFCQMGTDPLDGDFVYPKLIFLLGVTKGELQLSILQSLMKLFSHEEQMTNLLEFEEAKDFVQRIREFLSCSNFVI